MSDGHPAIVESLKAIGIESHSVDHYFYLARCSDDSLYAGTCVDPAEREAMHNSGKGAKYTRSRRPVRFVHIERFGTLSEARRREGLVKRWTRQEKQALVLRNNHDDRTFLGRVRKPLARSAACLRSKDGRPAP